MELVFSPIHALRALIPLGVTAIAMAILTASSYWFFRRKYEHKPSLTFAVTFACSTLLSCVVAVLILGLIIMFAPKMDHTLAIGLSITWIVIASLTGGWITTRDTIRLLIKKNEI